MNEILFSFPYKISKVGLSRDLTLVSNGNLTLFCDIAVSITGRIFNESAETIPVSNSVQIENTF